MNKKAKIALVALLLAAILAFGLVAAGKGGAKPPKKAKECNDGIDNDGDGAIDLADTGCKNKKDNDETDCGDGVCEGGETNSTCQTDCVPAQICGNNIREGTEVCDGSDLGGETCESQGFDGGTLGCNSNCDGFDTSGCYTNGCSDTDGGYNVEVQGTVSGSSNGNQYSYTDYCVENNATILVEYYCIGSQWYSDAFDCLTNHTGCLNGACV
jgi:hypothetical protein